MQVIRKSLLISLIILIAVLAFFASKAYTQELFSEYQSVFTQGAIAWESFTIGTDTFLAVANKSDGLTSNIDSKIYIWNGSLFVEVQSIPTHGAMDWESFTIGTDTFLAIANRKDDSTSNIDSKIYIWNESSFVEYQSIPTQGAYEWEFFTIGSDIFLAVANFYNDTTHDIDSKIYKWDGSLFVEYQSISTRGAVEWESFTIGSDSFLAVANHNSGDIYNINSKIYKWDEISSLFVEYQSIPTNGAHDWESFTIGHDTFLAIANEGDESIRNVDSKIYKWNGSLFVEYQSILTNGATDWESFTIGYDTFLTVAGYLGKPIPNADSKIYRWNGDLFVEIQSIPTNDEAIYWESFTIGFDTFLAVACYLSPGYGIALYSKIYKFNREFFAEFQSIPTQGAADWETFTIGSDIFLAVANWRNDTTNNVSSKIYKWNGYSFVDFQTIYTHGARDWESFTIGSDIFLAVANMYNDTTRNVDSEIYKWDESLSLFVKYQSILTNGAIAWESFTIGSDIFLAVANMYNDTTRNVDSKIYKWNGSLFVEFQSIPTHGAVDWKSFTIGSDNFLAVANYYNDTTYNIDSKIYNWNGSLFEEYQSIPTHGAADWEFFTTGTDIFLAVANVRNDTTWNVDSNIYKWNGISFVEVQSIPTHGAADWEFFTTGTDIFLAVAYWGNDTTYNVDSKIYKWNGSFFMEWQSIPTHGALDWEHFTIGPDNFLAVANYYNDTTYNINSNIYKLYGEEVISPEIKPNSVRVSNISSASATISWFTKADGPGEVHYSDDPNLANCMTAFDTRGEDHIDISHYVRLSGLNPETTYYFEVQSCDFTDNNEGNYFAFTTCAFSMGVTPKILKGHVYREDELTPADGAIVFVTITSDSKQSHPLSSLVDADARWSLDLRNLKVAADCSDLYWSAGDTIKIEARGEAKEDLLGFASEREEIASGTLPQDCSILILNTWTCYTLNLKTGYNLISLPLYPLLDEVGQPISYNSHSLMAHIPNCISLTNWDPDSQWYDTSYMDEGMPYGPIFDILPCRAYFVLVQDQTEVTFCGYLSTGPEIIELKNGYNFISCIYGANMPDDPKTGYTSYSVMEDIPQAITITDWDPLSQFYDTAYMDEGVPYGSIFDISVGRGFILLVDGAASWTPRATVSGMRMRKKPVDSVIRYRLGDAAEPIISDIMVSNNSSASATISWVTDTASTGIVRYSNDPGLANFLTASDERGSEYTGTSHYVRLSGLTQESTYYFEVQSGNTVDNNNGNYHSFRTCGFSMGVTPKILKGKVYQEDGSTPAEGAIVLVVVDGQSIPLSTLAGADARWDVDLRNLKKAQTCEDYYWAPGNNVQIKAKYGMNTGDDSVVIESGLLPQDCGTIIISSIIQFTCYRDADNDTYGDDSDSIQASACPQGYIRDNTDCDDTDPNTYPGAPEICDGHDNDCDDKTDEDLIKDCSNACGAGTKTCVNSQWTDCTAPPVSEEICDGEDNDCDGLMDEPGAKGCKTYYKDEDGDGYGFPGDSICLCPQDPNKQDPNYIFYTETEGGDCDDTDPSVYPRLVRVTNVEARPGDTNVKVPVGIDDTSGLAGGDIILTYDPNILIAQNIIFSPLLQGFYTDYNIIQDQGKIILGMASIEGLDSGQGTLLEIIFDVSEYAEEGTGIPLIFEELEIYNENEESICVAPIDGKFQIIMCTKGDVNTDGAITAQDAILVLRIAVKKLIPDEYQECAADVNEDGEINSADAIPVLKAAVKKKTIFHLKPDHGMAYTIVKIIGWNFGNEQGGSAVYFGDIPADPVLWTNHEIITIVPSGIPTGEVDVTIVNENGISSTPRRFTINQSGMRLRALDTPSEEEESPRTISIPSGITGALCEQITVPVDIDDASDITGMDLVFAFDPAILKPVKAECTDMSHGFLLMSFASEDGRFRVSGARDTGIISGAGAIINLIFDVLSNARGSVSTVITIEDVKLFDEKTDPIELIAHQNGEILINREGLCAGSSTPVQTYNNTYWKLLSPYGYHYSYNSSNSYNFSRIPDWAALWGYSAGMNYYFPNNGFPQIFNPVYPRTLNYYDYYSYSWNVQMPYPDISWMLAW